MSDDNLRLQEPSIDELQRELSYKNVEIEELEKTITRLKEEVHTQASEKERLMIESRLSIEDAELARSFSRKNYSQLLEDIFYIPAQKLRGEAVKALFLCTLLSFLVAYVISEVMHSYNQSDNTINAPSELTATLQSLQEQQDTTLQSIANLEEKLQTITASATEIAPPRKNHASDPLETESTIAKTEETLKADKPKIKSVREITIEEQTQFLLSNIESSKSQPGFPDYQSSKMGLAQLYLIVMQNMPEEIFYHEAYLNALRQLDISPEFMPTAIEDLIQMDIDYLYANFSAYVITSLKHQQKWRYRETDAVFSSYYDSALNYNLGLWNISNNEQDYSFLPQNFLANASRTLQHLQFNKVEFPSVIPLEIYYLAYDEADKNQSVSNLLGEAPFSINDTIMQIDISTMPLQPSKEKITQIQTALADNGFMEQSVINGIYGPKTKTAINNYKVANSLVDNSNIDLGLLNSLGLQPSFGELVSQKFF